jgi:hypothetical protein
MKPVCASVTAMGSRRRGDERGKSIQIDRCAKAAASASARSNDVHGPGVAIRRPVQLRVQVTGPGAYDDEIDAPEVIEKGLRQHCSRPGFAEILLPAAQTFGRRGRDLSCHRTGLRNETVGGFGVEADSSLVSRDRYSPSERRFGFAPPACGD